jgi:hypothetical protein
MDGDDFVVGVHIGAGADPVAGLDGVVSPIRTLREIPLAAVSHGRLLTLAWRVAKFRFDKAIVR